MNPIQFALQPKRLFALLWLAEGRSTNSVVARFALTFLLMPTIFVPPSAGAQTVDGGNANSPQHSFVTPPAPALRPREEMETFVLAPGYRAELIAADPLIQDPVAMTFDPNGRIWVCEMRGFMPDIDGNDEDAPVGVISVLEDTDGDGRMDKSTQFVDGLILPRGLCWTVDGLLVCENGTIWLCSDHDGDDRCDEKRVVCNYNPGNLEHALNGLMPALDNWVYNAKEGLRLRRIGGQWISQINAPRGQWGITQDDHGFLYYNVNASLIRGDLVPCYSPIAQTANPLVDVQLYDEQEVFPIRPTPGVNRGYLPGFLRPSGSIVEANANCGPVVYRGDNLPAELLGNVFIPEPGGNLIRRQVMLEEAGRKTSRNAYSQQEFWASTDERFRPVNMYNAPDGTLYVIDMYRGIIQHGAFITPYLRQQIVDRRLDQGIHLGRIYRVVHESTHRREPIALSDMSSLDLVQHLSSSNGWHRDMAQQLLVQRGEVSVVAAIEEVATSSPSPLGRLHALWTLEGLNRLDPYILYELLSDPSEHMRASAVTLYQRLLAVETMVAMAVEDVAEVAADSSPLVQLQVTQILGLVDSEQADQAIEPILKAAAQTTERLDGLLAGFAGRETEFLSARLKCAAWSEPEAWRATVLGATAKSMWHQRDPLAVLRFCHLLSTIDEQQVWQQIALLEGIQDPTPVVRKPRFAPYPGTETSAKINDAGDMPLESEDVPVANEPKEESETRREFGNDFRRWGITALKLHAPPEGLERLRQAPDARLAAAADAFAAKLNWPGKDGQPIPVKPKLTESQRRLFEIGRLEYATVCAGCHHPSGYGLAAKGPPLLGSSWLEDEPSLTRIVLHGVQGPISVGGSLYNAENRLSMPGMQKLLSDEKIAGVLTYVRREFADDSGPVAVEDVAATRRLLETREEPWTESELIQITPH